MPASVNRVSIFLDTTPPGAPSMTINGGVATVGTPTVDVSTFSTDIAGTGEGDVYSMKFWGDVDITADPNVQTSEGASSWIAYAADYLVRLIATPGLRTLYGRLQDDVGNQTAAFSATVTYNPLLPQVTVSQPLSKGRISAAPTFDLTTFGWQSSLAFTSYMLRVVPSPNSPVGAGVPLLGAGGSLNVAGGAGAALTTIVSTVRGADLLAASPGTGTKLVKVFVLAGGDWSV